MEWSKPTNIICVGIRDEVVEFVVFIFLLLSWLSYFYFIFYLLNLHALFGSLQLHK